MEAKTSRILEKECPLSKAIIWKLQLEAYRQFGIDAWRRHGVPCYITSNPYTAKIYAHLALGYLRDLLVKQRINPSKPIYLIDLGAGCGRFGYLFLKQFLSFLPRITKEIKIRYVMTDVVEANLSFLEKHIFLKPFIEKEILDVALFHHAQKTPLVLLNKGESCTKESFENPPILIANYFFDTLPQALFSVEKGQLFEGKVTTFVPKSCEVEVTDPSLINHLDWKITFSPMEKRGAFPNDLVHPVLEYYKKRLKEGTFLIPVGAFDTLDYFSSLSNNHYLLLAGDQGISNEKELEKGKEPALHKHGTFSLPVNYHALSLYFEKKGGFALLNPIGDSFFVVTAAVAGGSKEEFGETVFAFDTHLNPFEPKDYWHLAEAFEKKEGSFAANLALLKLGNWDPMNFHALYPILRKQLKKAPKELQNQLREGIHLAWEQFFPLAKEEGGFVMNLGVLLFEMGEFADALLFFQRAYDLFGETVPLLLNLGACHMQLLDPKRALPYFQRAKNLQNHS